MNAGFRALAATLALLVAATGAGWADVVSGKGEVTVDTDAIDLDGAASLEVSASVKGSSVYVNRKYVGKTDYASASLEPGNYLVEVSRTGYYTLGYFIVLAERTKYSLHFSLAPVTGFLSVSVQPPDAEILVDGRAVDGGFAELPVGEHEVTARRFGYEERRSSISILDRTTSSVVFELPLAAFSVSAPKPSRPAFNPANAGILGKTELCFEATSYGTARLEIRDSGGALVAHAEYPRLETWSQSFAWDGRDADGAALPDGDYRVLLFATPESGVPILPAGPGVGPDGSLSREASVRLDSSIVIRPLNTLAAVPGLLLFPEPAPQPAGTFAAELCWLSPGTAPEGSAFALGGGLSFGGVAALAFSAAAETSESPDGDGDLGLSLLYAYARKDSFAGALFLRGSWSSAETPVLPGSRTGIETSLPVAFRLGSVSVGAAPGLFVALDSGAAACSPMARAGAWIAGPAFRAGLSTALAFDISEGGLEPAWPLEACAEARAILAPTPLVIAGYLFADIEPGGIPSWGFGLGLGLLL